MSADGTVPISEYALFWNRPSFFAQIGGGALQGGTALVQTALQYRNSWFGFGTNIDYLFDKTDQLLSMDIGPSVNFGTSHLVFGLQPSLLITSGNGFQPQYGVGLRSNTTHYLDRTFLQFNPMLGYINRQWGYDLKIAIGYRITPAFSVDVGYSHRDILNLNDLNITETGLNGVFVHLGFRVN